jgi:hypothetical protein
VSEAAHGCELLLDGVRGQTSRLKVHAIPEYDNAVEGRPGFGAVPSNELVDGVLVNAARGRRAEAVDCRQFAMIQVWKPKHSATLNRGLAGRNDETMLF